MVNDTDISRVDLNLLVVFDIIYAERSLGRAATRLNLTRSAVSHSLGRLRRLLNDPLFIRTARGVVPTERAESLAAPVADLVARARSIIERAGPFDPSVTTRRFLIGASDGVSTVFIPTFLARLRRAAPGAAVGLKQLSPTAGERDPDKAWTGAYADLESREIDVAIVPSTSTPASFESRTLFEEDFVIAARADHPFAKAPTLAAYCAAKHLVVSGSGDPFGFVDSLLAEKQLVRQTIVTVPSFMFALAMVAETDLVAALPRRLLVRHGAAFGLVGVQPPLPLGSFEIRAVLKKGAVRDAGLDWVVELLAGDSIPLASATLVSPE